MHRELTLRDFVHIFQRRRAIFASIVCGFVILGALVCLLSPKKYKAVGTIELETPYGDGLDRDSLMGGGSVNSDALSSDVAIQTQAKILQSDTLALRTIEALHLAGEQAQSKQASAKQPPSQSEARELTAFRSALTVKPIAGTKLVEITFSDKSPEVAAAVVNELARQLILFGEEQTFSATNEAAKTLTKELDGLRSQSEDLQKQVAAMQSQTGLYEEGTTDGGTGTQAYSAVLAQFQRAAATLSDATQNKILKDSIYRVARTGDADQISSLAGNSIGGSNSSLSNSLGLIESLRANQSQMQTQLDQLKVKFGPEYPKIQELKAGIASSEKSIQAETKRIMERAQTDAAIADQTWISAQDNYNSLKAQADALNSKTVDYRITLQEADQSRTLYADLLKKLKEAGVLQGLRSTNITLVDSAVAPRLPSQPVVPLYMAASVGLGVMLGLLAIVAIELLDDRVMDYIVVEDLGLGITGVVPRLVGGDGITVDDGVLAIYHNAVRTIRAKVDGAGVGTGGTVVAVVPSTPFENARQFALSLTGSISQSGQKTLFVEGNSGRQETRLLKVAEDTKKLPGGVAMTGDAKNSNLPLVCHLNHELTPSGSPLVQDSKKLAERLLEWRTQYDVIIIDAASQLFDANAATLCDHADVVLQVVTYGVTTKTSLRRSSTLQKQRSGKAPWMVIQGVPVNSLAFSTYYGCSPTLSNIEELRK